MNNLTKYSNRSLFGSINDLFDNMFFQPFELFSSDFPDVISKSFPKLEHMSTKDGDKLYGTVPGYDKESIKASVTVKNNSACLNISAKAQEKTEDKEIFSTIKRSAFKRSILLSPVEKYDLDNITAKVENGILEINLPFNKTFKDVGKEINIPIK